MRITKLLIGSVLVTGMGYAIRKCMTYRKAVYHEIHREKEYLENHDVSTHNYTISDIHDHYTKMRRL